MHRTEQIGFAFWTFHVPQRGRGDRAGRQGGLYRRLRRNQRRRQKQSKQQQQDVCGFFHSRHTAPTTITSADTTRRPLSVSAKNILPSSTANSTLVSRKADTAPIDARVMAKITMP